MHYPCSENKGADQLRGYREADLRLCFSPMKIVGFPMRRLILCLEKSGKAHTEMNLIILITSIFDG